MFLFIQQILVDFHCVSGTGDTVVSKTSTLFLREDGGCDDGNEWVLGLKRVSGRTPEILNMNSQPGAFLTLAKHV